VSEAVGSRGPRAAVVGTGFIGLVHVDALRRLGVEIVGIVGSSPERVREKARTYPLPEPYADFEAMLADPRVDVVHITSPNHLHFPQAKAALEAGKHVICEKPLGMDSAQTAELLDLAEASGLVHAVNFNIRFYPQCREARERVAGGAVGDVRLITGSYLQDWLLYDTDWNWRLEDDRGGALRAVGDIGSHWIDLMTYVTGRHVESVIADLTTFIGVRREPVGPVETFSGASGGETVPREMHTEDTASILLRFDDGARGAVTVSQISAGRKNHLSCGSATATARTRCCCATRHCSRPRPPPSPRCPAATPRASRTRSASSTARSTARSRPAVRPPSLTTRRSPTATRRR
jgi:predicted dehydrogenase